MARYFLRARDWPAYYELSIHPVFFQRAPLLNPFNDSEIAEDINGLRNNIRLRSPPRVIEMHLKRKELCSEELDIPKTRSVN